MKSDTPHPIKALIDDKKYCTCCNRTTMQKSFTFASEGNDIPDIYLGTICATRWFDVNLTGNRFASLDRLQRKIDAMGKEKLLDLFEAIIVQGSYVE